MFMTNGPLRVWEESKTGQRASWHVGCRDRRHRKLLQSAMKAIEENDESTLLMRAGSEVEKIYGPVTNDTIAETSAWQSGLERAERERREGCPGMHPFNESVGAKTLANVSTFTCESPP